jgi:uncharacterized protein YfaS (alpha-2-macroglobulin family)
MTINVYDTGDLVRCTGTFATDGTNVDPTAVLFKVKSPTGTVTTYTYGTDVQLVKSATGIYYVNVSATENGMYRYRFYSTGTGQAASEGQFRVRDSLI